MVEKTLVPAKEYLQTGAHIGAKFKSEGMRKYIYKSRKDKLKVLDVGTIDERIRIAASFLSTFEPEKIVAVSQKEYGQTPVKKFAELTGVNALLGRFVPGSFTNPNSESFIEPEVVLVTDPNSDRQSIKEAKRMKLPVVAMCSTDNHTGNIDLIVPVNNKGRKSLALVYWLLSRELLRLWGKVKTEKDFTAKVEDFEFLIDEKSQLRAQKMQFAGQRRGKGRGSGRGKRR